MTHETWHSVFFVAGFIYFAVAFVIAFINYRKTHGEGFWFFSMLFSLFFSFAMLSGFLLALGAIDEIRYRILYSIFFLVGNLFAFVAIYTLSKKHHKVRVF